MNSTLELKTFKVSLAGFRYTGHQGPDELVHLSPVHRGDYDTKPVTAMAYVVEAVDASHAEKVFCTSMGISKSEREFKVEELVDPEEAAAAAAAKKKRDAAQEALAKEKAEAERETLKAELRLEIEDEVRAEAQAEAAAAKAKFESAGKKPTKKK